MNSKPSRWLRILPKRTSFALLFGALLFLAGGAAALADPWLFVSDIHLKANYKDYAPSRYGDDTDQKLFDLALAEMKRATPHPPVVVITGDLLAHIIEKRQTTPTTIAIAKAFDRAFPDAQFLLALGNNDGACGDYGLTPDSAFLREAGKAWAPLIDRHHAAPDFLKTFAHDGSYTATLPVPGLSAIVVNDVYWSPRYRSGCGPAPNAAANATNELDAALQRAPGRVWVLFHIPPGIDAYSTANLVHRLAIVPFLSPDRRDALLALLARKPGQVALAVAGHTHKFAYRIAGDGAQPVPMLLVPALSPIFRNAASFLTANVASDGTLRDLEETSYLNGRWERIGGMHDLGVDVFDGKHLAALSRRLDGDEKLRDTFERLYGGGAPSEATDRTWSVYGCAATSFTSAAFRKCDSAGGIVFVTQRGVKVIIAAACVALLAVAGIAYFVLARRRRVRP